MRLPYSLVAPLLIPLSFGCVSRHLNEDSGDQVQERVSSGVDESLVKSEDHAVRVNLATNITTYYRKGVAKRSWKVASARNDGKSITPNGTFRFHELETCPPWVSTRNGGSASPCANDNPLGKTALWFLSAEYGLHGVDDAHIDSVTAATADERRQSSGCVRNHPEDIKWLAAQVAGAYGTTAAELDRLRANAQNKIFPAKGKGVVVVVGRFPASVDGSTSGSACSAETAKGRILSSGAEIVTDATGKKEIGKTKPWEPVCPTGEKQSGRARLFFPLPPEGYGHVEERLVRTCDLSQLKICISNSGGNEACHRKNCTGTL